MNNNEDELEKIIAEDCLTIIYKKISDTFQIMPTLNYSIYFLYYDYMNNRSEPINVDFNVFIASIICVLKLNDINFDLDHVIHIFREVLQEFYHCDKNEIMKYEISILKSHGFNCLHRDPYALFDVVPDQEEVISFFQKYESNELFYQLNNTEIFFLFYHNKTKLFKPYPECQKRIDVVINN